MKLGVALLAALVWPAAAAHADLRYQTDGEDVYRIASTATVSRVSYAGTERLSINRRGGSVRFEAHARYTRTAPDGKSSLEALFVQRLGADGSFEDRDDRDPNFLTILNQPFAVQLDSATLRDVRELRGRVPFTATSPLGDTALLRGFLRPGIDGRIEGRSTTAVRFEAEGPLNGPLRGHPNATVSGQMRMDGTAYYALDNAILMALYVTLTINARLKQDDASASVPVQITYRRSIRAADSEKSSSTVAR